MNRYACRLGYIHRRIGHVPLAELAAPAIRSCYAAMKTEDGLSPHTIRMTHGLLKSALQHAVREEILVRNPCELVDPPKVEKYEPAILSLEEMRRVITESTESRHHAL